MTRHTPRPWTVNVWTTGRRTVEVNGLVIAEVHQTHVETERSANARLITAAPELLEACEEIVKHATRYGASPLSASKMFDRCRAAIAKATGG